MSLTFSGGGGGWNGLVKLEVISARAEFPDTPISSWWSPLLSPGCVAPSIALFLAWSLCTLFSLISLGQRGSEIIGWTDPRLQIDVLGSLLPDFFFCIYYTKSFLRAIFSDIWRSYFVICLSSSFCRGVDNSIELIEEIVITVLWGFDYQLILSRIYIAKCGTR